MTSTKKITNRSFKERSKKVLHEKISPEEIKDATKELSLAGKDAEESMEMWKNVKDEPDEEVLEKAREVLKKSYERLTKANNNADKIANALKSAKDAGLSSIEDAPTHNALKALGKAKDTALSSIEDAPYHKALGKAKDAGLSSIEDAPYHQALGKAKDAADTATKVGAAGTDQAADLATAKVGAAGGTAKAGGIGSKIAGFAKGVLSKIAGFYKMYGIKAVALTAGGLVAAYLLYKIIKKLRKGKNTPDSKEAIAAYKTAKKNDFSSVSEADVRKISSDPYYATMYAIALRTHMKPVPEYIYEGLAEDPHNAFLFAKAIKFKLIPEIIERSILSSKYASQLPKSYTVESLELRLNRRLSVLFS